MQSFVLLYIVITIMVCTNTISRLTNMVHGFTIDTQIYRYSTLRHRKIDIRRTCALPLIQHHNNKRQQQQQFTQLQYSTNSHNIASQTCCKKDYDERIPSGIFSTSMIRQQRKEQQQYRYFGLNILGRKSLTRSFGSKPGGPDGEIMIEDDQELLPNINLERLKATVNKIRSIIGYPSYDISLFLVMDEEMQSTNLESRGFDKPTDILSFPFQDSVPNSPGQLLPAAFDVADYYTLGDIVIDVEYVIRQCEEDRLYNEKQSSEGLDNVNKNESTSSNTTDGLDNDSSDDDEYEYVDEDRGVAIAMATVYDPEERINMLLIHGILHLVGYDHETDDDNDLMMEKEEEILELLGYKKEKVEAST